MAKIFNFEEAGKKIKDEKLQEHLNDVWDSVVAAGIVRKETKDDKLFSLRVRDAIFQKLLAAGLVLPGPYESEKEIRKVNGFRSRSKALAAYDYDNVTPEEFNEIVNHVVGQITSPGGYLTDVIFSSMTNKDTNEPSTMVMIRYHKLRVDNKAI